MQHLLKKISIFLFTIAFVAVFNPAISFAANTHSIDLERGSSQSLSITDASQTGLDFTGDFSLETWVKVESAVDGTSLEYNFISKYLPAGNQRSYSWNYAYNGGTELIQLLTSDDGSSVAVLSVTRTLPTGDWIHLALTYDASAGLAKFYFDGSQEGGDQTGGKTSILNGTSPFEIGAQAGGFQFDGLMDDTRAWSDIRTTAEIADNRSLELVGNESNLEGYWKLNNDLLDSTSGAQENSNDLTNNNSAVFSTDVPFTEVTRSRVIMIQ